MSNTPIAERKLYVEKIPEVLRNCPQWVSWKLEVRGGSKPTKVPLNPNTGGKASSTDPTTWSNFERAFELASRNPNANGVGFVFTIEAGIVGIDLDHCLNNETGALLPWAQEIVTMMNSYSERSPSGDGLHILVRARMSDGMRNKTKMPDGGAIEIYDRARYFTVTGEHLPDTPNTIEERSQELKTIHAQFFPPSDTVKASTKKANSAPTEMPVADLDGRLKVAMMADPMLKKLWHGITSDYSEDESAADLALCNKLVNIFGPDPKVINEVFRQSGLMRDKWERSDYRQWTIMKAMDEHPNTDAAKQKKAAKIGGQGGRGKPSLRDVVRALTTYPDFQDFWYDEFLQRGLTGNPPREWTDHDDLELAVKLQGFYGFSQATVETIRQAVTAVMKRRRKNCVRDWMESLVWDGTPRIDKFLVQHFGADDTEYTRAASKNFWIAMVARVYKPGCQVDTMLVLDGPQGIGKSSALRAIGGEWFAEQHESATSKDFYQVLQGKMLVEISEMDSFSRAEVTKVKQVVTCTNDRYRESYGRQALDHPRQCIFVGTSNKWSHDDETGARRFWPIECRGTVDIEAMLADRSQLFAEAVYRFKSGESWWVMPVEETLAQQQARFNVPALAQPIQWYIDHDPFDDGEERGWIQRETPKTQMTMSDVLRDALKLPESQWSGAERVVAKALRSLGWDNKPEKVSGKTIRVWRPKAAASVTTPTGNVAPAKVTPTKT
jgi:hypothetical protein